MRCTISTTLPSRPFTGNCHKCSWVGHTIWDCPQWDRSKQVKSMKKMIEELDKEECALAMDKCMAKVKRLEIRQAGFQGEDAWWLVTPVTRAKMEIHEHRSDQRSFIEMESFERLLPLIYICRQCDSNKCRCDEDISEINRKKETVEARETWPYGTLQLILIQEWTIKPNICCQLALASTPAWRSIARSSQTNDIPNC